MPRPSVTYELQGETWYVITARYRGETYTFHMLNQGQSPCEIRNYGRINAQEAYADFLEGDDYWDDDEEDGGDY